MLPIYKAIAFDKIIDKGGRTKPWSVIVDTGNGVRAFVVKMFTTQLVEARDSVTNEVMGNILAKEFDLPVPDAALIEMDEYFRMTIRDTDALVAYDQADERIKFGSALTEGNYLFSPTFTKAQAAKMIELDTLFAFDLLICNKDRRAATPNLLVKGKSAYLIDHELGFEIDSNTLAGLQHGKWDDSYYRNHIFWNYLKKSKPAKRIEYFNTFAEYLRTLNVNRLTTYFQQLDNHGFSTEKHQLIRDYLIGVKQNSSIFINFLKLIIE